MANILNVNDGKPLVSNFNVASGVTVKAGDVVKKTNETTVDKVTLADNDTTPVYVVKEGNDTYSGQAAKMAVCLSGNFEATLTSYTTGSYTVNALVSAASGLVSVQAGSKPSIGHVLSFSLSQGLKVRFSI
jgi:hypothetical protein